jgi:UPF0271 protein
VSGASGAGRVVDLNADVGEAGDEAGIAVERALLGLVTSAHVACGGHAGDQASMHATVLAALHHGVRVGAHPSYPDRAGFGRQPMEMAFGALQSALRAQLGDLIAVAEGCGTSVGSVKPHGALYADVARGGVACVALLGVMAELCHPDTPLILPAGAPARPLVKEMGLATLAEGFCDRAYTADGKLQSRQEAGSVFADPAQAAAQAISLARDGTVVAHDGTVLTLRVDTLCLHGDSPQAAAMATAVRRAFAAAGIAVTAALAPQP